MNENSVDVRVRGYHLQIIQIVASRRDSIEQEEPSSEGRACRKDNVGT